MTDRVDRSLTRAHHSAEVVTRVLGNGEETYRLARERAGRLEALDVDGIVLPQSIAVRDSGEVVAEVPALVGHDVSAVLRMRGRLRLGECVRLGRQVSGALSAMHTAGVPHGDISAANVMVSQGRVVLVDCIAGGFDLEAGTEPYAAPERGKGATAAADVYALGQLLRECVRDSERERIEPWLVPMTAEDPQARPTAAMVERALGACAPECDIDVPVLSVASDVRARAQGPAHLTTRVESGKAWRLRKAVMQWGTVALIAMTAAVVLWTVALPSVSAAVDPPQQPHFDPPMPIPADAAVSPAEGARQVTLARFEALVTGDAERLIATTAADSPAREHIEDQAQALEEGVVMFSGLEVDMLHVETLSQAGRRATVWVHYDVGSHRMEVGEDVTEFAGYEQSVELDLAWSKDGWQVLRVRPGPSPNALHP